MTKFHYLETWDDPRAEAGKMAIRAHNLEKGCPINNKEFSMIMEDDTGNIQAVIRAWSEWNWAFIATIYVYNQGKGIGRQFMEHFEGWSKQQGYTGIYLATSTFQTPAFYDALGYECIGKIPNFVNGHDRLFYAKRFA